MYMSVFFATVSATFIGASKTVLPNVEVISSMVASFPAHPLRAFSPLLKLVHLSTLSEFVFDTILFLQLILYIFMGIRIYTYFGSQSPKMPRGTNLSDPKVITGKQIGFSTKREVKSLATTRAASGRIVLGEFSAVDGLLSFICSILRFKMKKPFLISSESGHSVLVIGPTQSHKTSGFAIPAILEWEGPIIATSVKSDLMRDTIPHRSKLGEVFVIDPTNSTGLSNCHFSPVKAASTWPNAKKIARDLSLLADSLNSGIEDSAFWYQMAAKLLAPLLFAACVGDKSMADVIRWLDVHEISEPTRILIDAGVIEAIQSAEASWKREERQLASIYATAENIVEAFSLVESKQNIDFEPSNLFKGQNTLYLCAPAHDQVRMVPYFATAVSHILNSAYDQVARTGKPLDPPLLVVLDEAANIAPISNLDTFASTSSSQGIQLVSIWQDIAQIKSRYGTKGATVINNHRTKVILSGVSDPETLEVISSLMGQVRSRTTTTSRDSFGSFSHSMGHEYRPMMEKSALRGIKPGTGIVIHGHLAPFEIKLRPWFKDKKLKNLVHD